MPGSRITAAIIAAICVGIGQPPSWTGGNSVTGLRHDSDLEIETGMSFHILSWLMGTGRGDDFISNTVLLTDTRRGGAHPHADRPDRPLGMRMDRHFHRKRAVR